MATKKNIDPGRPISRPMAPISKDAGWGKQLSKDELLSIIDRIYQKQADRDAQKLADKKSK